MAVTFDTFAESAQLTRFSCRFTFVCSENVDLALWSLRRSLSRGSTRPLVNTIGTSNKEQLIFETMRDKGVFGIPLLVVCGESRRVRGFPDFLIIRAHYWR